MAESFYFLGKPYTLSASQQIVNVNGPWGRNGRKAFTRRRKFVGGVYVDETAADMLARVQQNADAQVRLLMPHRSCPHVQRDARH